MANLVAPNVQQQAVSVTRKMSASLPGLREIAAQRGLKVHHLGAGYPHPEVTDPRGFLEHQEAYFFIRNRGLKIAINRNNFLHFHGYYRVFWLLPH